MVRLVDAISAARLRLRGKREAESVAPEQRADIGRARFLIGLAAATGAVARSAVAESRVGPGGPIDSSTVTAAGGRIARSLADWMRQWLSPSDFSATPGSAEFQAAQNVRQAEGGGTIYVRPGAYTLGKAVYTAGSNAWVFERGASINGSEIDAVTDGQALGASGLTLARILSSPTNEFILHLSGRAGPTNAAASYEKAGLYVRLLHQDPSSLSPQGAAISKDVVGAEYQVAITPGNMTGRAWGIDVSVGAEPGGDGYAVGAEIGVYANGAESGHLGTPTSKIAAHLLAAGTSDSTAAIAISNAGARFLDGLVVQTNSIQVGGHALSIRPPGSNRTADLAYIGQDGTAHFTALTATAVVAAGLSGGNQVVLEGSVAGRPGGLSATGADPDVAVQLLGKGRSGALTGVFVRETDPTTTDIPAGQCADWHNTTRGTYKRVCNFGGILRSISYTKAL